jgi:hypothetical protein
MYVVKGERGKGAEQVKESEGENQRAEWEK